MSAQPAAQRVATASTRDIADDRRRKAKYAVVFGYVGEKYHGLQHNRDPTHPTIEQYLLNALHKAGLISDRNMFDDSKEAGDVFRKISWQRSSRTDKGVHALVNLLSAKFFIPGQQGDPEESLGEGTIEAEAAAVVRINELLPADIRVYSMQQVTSSFSSYVFCSGRKYHYYLPTFALMGPETFRELLPASIAPAVPTSADDVVEEAENDGPDDEEEEAPDENEGQGRKKNKRHRTERDVRPAEIADGEKVDDASTGAAGLWSRNPDKMFTYKQIDPAVMARLARVRIDAASLQHSRRLFEKYVGTLRFHNFTPRGKSSNPSTIRHIRSVTVSDPLLVAVPLPEDESERAALLSKYAAQPCDDGKINFAPSTGTPTAVVEFVRIELDGQSFMYNQIRKMIGAVCFARASGCDDSWLEECMNRDVRRGLPMAPANGLFLVHLDYPRYNVKLGHIQEHAQAPDKRAIDMSAAPAAAVDEMRRQILAAVVRNEVAGDIWGRWMRSLRQVAFLAMGVDLP